MTAGPPRPATPLPESMRAAPGFDTGPDEYPAAPDASDDRIAVGHDQSGRPYAVRLPAPDATAGDGLELQSQLYALLGGRTSTPLGVEWQHERLRRLVSDVLALPALRDVLAAAARDAELREAVTSLAVRFETLGEALHSVPAAEAYADAAASLREALDDPS